MNDTELIGWSKNNSMAVPVERLGTPGAHGVLHVIPHLDKDRVPDKDKDLIPDKKVLSDTSVRQFVVSARLSKAPSGSDGVQANFTEKDGGSYLLLSSAALAIDTPWGRCLVKKNDLGEISHIEFKCMAADPLTARAMFIEAVYPALDHFSYTYNVALFVTLIRVHDTKHQSTHIEYVAPFRKQLVADAMNLLYVEMKPVYSMYREAKNSDSSIYQFLCYYKIMEGLLNKMRASVAQRAREAGISLRFERDAVPDDKHIPPALRPHIGAPIKQFFDEMLTDKFRNAAAHFITDDDRVLHVSSAADLETYAQIAFASDLCVRVLIKRHEALLAQLRAS